MTETPENEQRLLVNYFTTCVILFALTCINPIQNFTYFTVSDVIILRALLITTTISVIIQHSITNPYFRVSLMSLSDLSFWQIFMSTTFKFFEFEKEKSEEQHRSRTSLEFENLKIFAFSVALKLTVQMILFTIATHFSIGCVKYFFPKAAIDAEKEGEYINELKEKVLNSTTISGTNVNARHDLMNNSTILENSPDFNNYNFPPIPPKTREMSFSVPGMTDKSGFKCISRYGKLMGIPL